MKKYLLSVLAAALIAPFAALAQDETEEIVVPGRTIPKFEFSVGGGFGVGGYLGTFPGSPWMNRVAQGADADMMQFYLPHSGLRPSGHAGLYLDVNFTDHWGLITGAEFAAYTSVVKSQNLLNVFPLWTKEKNPVEDVPSAEDWIGSNLPNFLEQHRMFAVQIPLMGKYMTPISPLKGHQYYVAAGLKLGIRISSQYKQSFEDGQFCKFAYKYYFGEKYERGDIHTYMGKDGVPMTWIHPDCDYSDKDKEPLNADWMKLKFCPVDVSASFDTGIRWNLGKGWGIYTGLYCDFGLIRPIVHQEGLKVLNFDPEKNQSYGDDGEVFLEGAKYTSVLAADAPDYCYRDSEMMPGTQGNEDPDHFVYNRSPFAKTLSAMQAGVKIRVSFGKVQKPVKKVKPPKEPKQPKPKPEVVPPKIQRTMMELSNTLFAFDKFDLNEKAQEMLNEVADWLKENPDLNVEIGGHTDSRGSDAYNQKLSENRAKAVYDYFVSHGVSASRLSYKGYGESRPIATNETDEGRQLNRRVELQILETQE